MKTGRPAIDALLDEIESKKQELDSQSQATAAIARHLTALREQLDQEAAWQEAPPARERN
jgi:hypothetical protein